MASIPNQPYIERSSTNIPPLFNGTNYTFWKSRIRIYICSINFELWSIVEKGSFVPKKDRRVKKVKEFDEFDSRKMTLSFQTMNILSCGLDVNQYNRVSGCDSAHEIWKLFEVTHEESKIKKKGKGLIEAWDQDSSESEEEESTNMCFMALENEVQSSPSNLSSFDDDDDDYDPNSIFPKRTRS
ncbi:hypothetical protein M9H77_03832 [Catharanthus roseus]|uniref:Uncharacterized protein n=1 Tax=Catharanthus roseus TaxID=4058 RepID=A0ACC0CCT3_CATRO|nr:hypothetical protein M9H77_03832 [Catharanthus roseus]